MSSIRDAVPMPQCADKLNHRGTSMLYCRELRRRLIRCRHLVRHEHDVGVTVLRGEGDVQISLVK
jgi:hypothetical protein